MHLLLCWQASAEHTCSAAATRQLAHLLGPLHRRLHEGDGRQRQHAAAHWLRAQQLPLVLGDERGVYSTPLELLVLSDALQELSVGGQAADLQGRCKCNGSDSSRQHLSLLGQGKAESAGTAGAIGSSKWQAPGQRACSCCNAVCRLARAVARSGPLVMTLAIIGS